ncbi:MAG: sarcosine oxidase subunit gamma [Rhodobacteraceae bacterium]|nr:sarcosine oxidase subunit gamma [Paracoccaceae bacterium]
MFETISALNHAEYDGLAHISEIGLQGMITLRGDLNAKAIKTAATKAAGVSMPASNCVETTQDSGLCWMSPDELLVMCAYDDVTATLAQMHKTLGKTHAMAVNVSDARAVFQVSGPYAREVMAKLCPVDLSPEAFKAGMFRRTRMAQVPAAFWMSDEQTFQIICFRSVAEYVFELLKIAAQPHSEIDYSKRHSSSD